MNDGKFLCIPAQPALIENPNEVQSTLHSIATEDGSFSPGLAREAVATPGNVPQSSAADPEAARSANQKLRNIIEAILGRDRPLSMPRPPTNPHLKSTLPNPKSTVDLGCEPLIRVENTSLPSILPDRRHLFASTTTQHLRRANRTPTAAHQKTYSASLLIQVEKRTLEFGPSLELGSWSLGAPRGASSRSKVFQGVPNRSKPFSEKKDCLNFSTAPSSLRSILSFCQKSVSRPRPGISVAI
jgi:hypothetical protein